MQGGDRKHREQFPPSDYISAADLVFWLAHFSIQLLWFQTMPLYILAA